MGRTRLRRFSAAPTNSRRGGDTAPSYDSSVRRRTPRVRCDSMHWHLRRTRRRLRRRSGRRSRRRSRRRHRRRPRRRRRRRHRRRLRRRPIAPLAPFFSSGWPGSAALRVQPIVDALPFTVLLVPQDRCADGRTADLLFSRGLSARWSLTQKGVGHILTSPHQTAAAAAAPAGAGRSACGAARAGRACARRPSAPAGARAR